MKHNEEIAKKAGNVEKSRSPPRHRPHLLTALTSQGGSFPVSSSPLRRLLPTQRQDSLHCLGNSSIIYCSGDS